MNCRSCGLPSFVGEPCATCGAWALAAIDSEADFLALEGTMIGAFGPNSSASYIPKALSEDPIAADFVEEWS